jgi:hypothetical protein
MKPAIDFQECPYDILCGCVAIFIPSHMQYLWNKGPNLEATKRLLENGKGKRIVLADCPCCSGSGIKTQNNHPAERER